jgi:hypothetical protein
VRLPLLLLLAACTAPPDAQEARPAAEPRARETSVDPVLARAAARLRDGDIAGAAATLERDRWFADDRARAALLLCGCLLAEGDFARGMDVLREYLAKTTRVRSARDTIALRLLRHHATGGGLKAESAEEACYFGLYALKALGEGETARPDLEWALRAAPAPERALVEAAWRS